MSDEICIHVAKGTKVRVFEDGVEVAPRMSDEQFAELLQAIHDMQPAQIVPMPYPVPQPYPFPTMPQPIVVPYPTSPYTAPYRWYITTCGTSSADSKTSGITAIN